MTISSTSEEQKGQIERDMAPRKPTRKLSGSLHSTTTATSSESSYVSDRGHWLPSNNNRLADIFYAHLNGEDIEGSYQIHQDCRIDDCCDNENSTIIRGIHAESSQSSFAGLTWHSTHDVEHEKKSKKTKKTKKRTTPGQARRKRHFPYPTPLSPFKDNKCLSSPNSRSRGIVQEGGFQKLQLQLEGLEKIVGYVEPSPARGMHNESTSTDYDDASVMSEITLGDW